MPETYAFRNKDTYDLLDGGKFTGGAKLLSMGFAGDAKNSWKPGRHLYRYKLFESFQHE
jgi:hypothetical protein